MDEPHRPTGTERAPDPGPAHEHAAHLQRRTRELAEEIAGSEDDLADVLEESARLRPHAAARLGRMAQEARAYGERERRFARTPLPEDPPDPSS